MTKQEAATFIKAINRWVRNHHVFEGGRTFGVDYATFQVCYPQIAKAFNRAASVYTGREITRGLPIFP